MNFRELDRQVLVADRAMRPENMAEAAARGVTLAVNNRPDGEADDQYSGEELAAAAKAAGLDYVHIPVDGPLSGEKVAALDAAMKGAEGRVLVFCLSGTRSTYLWAMARAAEGMPIDLLDKNARRAGYNVTPLRPWLERLAAARETGAPPN
jgi:uncharacterized protein (TIGR01244 family)